MSMTKLNRLLIVALFLGLVVYARAADDKPKEPLGAADVIKLVKSDIEDDVIIAQIKKRGIDFKADSAALKRLKAAGVSETVLAALKAAGDDSPPAGGDKPLGTAKFQKGLVIDVTDVQRTSDGYLKVSFQVRNPTDESVTHTISGVSFIPEAYYVDVGPKTKHQIVRDDRGNYVAAPVPGTITLGPGEKAEYWAKFGAPGKGVKKITLYFRQAEPIEDIRVPPASNSADDDSKPAGGAGKALGTGKFQKGLVIDITDVARASENTLKVSFSIRNPTQASVTHTISGVYFVPESYYVEGGAKLKHMVSRDASGNYLASPVPGTITLGPGEKVDYWFKFSAPGKGVKKITLYFRQAEPIEDLPVPAPEK
jgi:hypothetical protein